MMFAKSAMGKKILMSRWNELVRERIYVALVEGTFQGESGLFDSWLIENRAGTVYVAEPGVRGALRAITRWRVLKKGNLSAAGHPVAGDTRYKARTDPLGRLCLHATALTIEHPFTKQIMRFENPFPDEFLSFCRN
jgi:23S rRNA pseudouridine1911/1915/1917 synthase